MADQQNKDPSKPSSGTQPKEPSWFDRKIEEGASIRLKTDKVGVDINPFRLPKVRFWRSPDVLIVWRSLCRSLITLRSDKPKSTLVSFDEVCQQRGVTPAQLIKIESNLLLSARASLFFFVLALLVGAYMNQFTVWLVSGGSAFLSGVLYWKYSFLLWQVRLRSLDKHLASIQAFMKESWYIEIFK